MSAGFDFRQVAERGEEIVAAIGALREADAISWNESVRGWMVARYADVLEGFSGRLPLSSARYFAKMFRDIPEEERRSRYPLLHSVIPGMIVNSDPPQHTRLRRLLVRAFGPKVVEAVRPYARSTIAQVLDGIAPREQVEFVGEVGRAITGRVIMRMLGVSEEHLAHLHRWSIGISTAMAHPQPTRAYLDAGEQVLAELHALFAAEVAERRRAPRGDFLSELVLARDGSDSMSEAEILGTCVVTLLAGHDSTTNTMTFGTVALLRDPAAREVVLAHPERLGASIVELMRYIAMSTTMVRIATEDFTWQGKSIRKGDLVYLLIAGANRDPRYFANPETFDPQRTEDVPMTFGPGLHHCIGHLLARMQLAEFFPAFLQRFPQARVVDEKLRYTPILGFRGLETLQVALRGG